MLGRNGFECSVSSPPFAEVLGDKPSKSIIEGGLRLGASTAGQDGYGTTPGNLGNLKAGNLDSAISSPPFGGSELSTDENLRANMKNPGRNFSSNAYGNNNLANLKAGNVDSVISSPPFMEAQSGGGIADAILGKGNYQVTTKLPRNSYQKDEQGTTDGQLSAMKPGNLDASISSPPYAESASGNGGLNTQPGKDGQQSGRNPNSPSQDSDNHYGDSKGQLSAMKLGELDAAVSSPPFENVVNTKDEKYVTEKPLFGDYGNTDGNIGNDKGDTFWSAARTIVDQTYLALKPGAYSAWVVKNFVRNKTLVDFPGQWQKLCEACGFETVEYIRAWVTEDKGTQIDLENQHHKKQTERKSFFRRLAESKGSPRIDFEVVLVMRKVNE